MVQQKRDIHWIYNIHVLFCHSGPHTLTGQVQKNTNKHMLKISTSTNTSTNSLVSAALLCFKNTTCICGCPGHFPYNCKIERESHNRAAASPKRLSTVSMESCCLAISQLASLEQNVLPLYSRLCYLASVFRLHQDSRWCFAFGGLKERHIRFLPFFLLVFAFTLRHDSTS